MKSSAALAPALREAAQIVARVAAGRSLADEFELSQARPRETPRAALIDLTHGTLRLYGRVQALVKALSSKGRPDAQVEALVWCALYALESGRYTEYTVVDQAVRACGLLERWGAKGYVNAVLRAYLRQRVALQARIQADAEARFQHPKWWLENLQRAYPERWAEAAAAGNLPPPMCLRVNLRRTTLEAYTGRLAERSMPARVIGRAALLLERPVPVELLPGFGEGEVSVQDCGAQRAAGILDLRNGQRVLDACAAPGGKAAHLLESADIALTALDADDKRCARMARNFERLGLRASVQAADCTRPDAWWDGAAYDRVLADVPCTASGVARRHPDVKWLRRASDIERFAKRQGQILDALWRTVAADGKLLYVTCSVFAGENDDVVDAFLARTPDARHIPTPDGVPAQSLPAPEHDGFFHALIARQA